MDGVAAIERRPRRARRAVLGLFLIGLGAALFLGQVGFWSALVVWKLWPAVLILIGVNHAMDRKPGGAAMFFLMGLAFFAAEFRWLGLSYARFWPLLVVAVGVGIVIATLSGEDARRSLCVNVDGRSASGSSPEREA